MFSPDLVRFIIDPDNSTEERAENRKVSVENEIFRFSILDHQKVLSDYSFFSRVLSSFGKTLAFLASRSKNYEIIEGQK